MAKEGTALLLAVQQAVSNIGHKNGTAAPRVNNTEDQLVLEYAIASALYKSAEDRKEAAATAVKQHFKDEIANVPQSSTMTVHSSDYCTLNVQIAKGAARLDKAKLTNELQKRFKLSKEDAEAFVLSCSNVSADSIRLSGTLLV